jgi:hypothetical protein
LIIDKSLSALINDSTLVFRRDATRDVDWYRSQIPGAQEESDVSYSCSLPPDIPDVQTIEKMQLIGQGHPSNCYDTGPLKNGNDCSADCDISERTSVEVRPPVVILSGFGNSKEVPGLVFGFDINEQLLSEDDKSFRCEEFISRYVAPEVYTTTSHNHDKIVSFIGAGEWWRCWSWERVLTFDVFSLGGGRGERVER